MRSTLDGLSAKAGGCVIKDDALVVKLSCEKRYVTDAEGCGAIIRVVESQYDPNDPALTFAVTLKRWFASNDGRKRSLMTGPGTLATAPGPGPARSAMP